MSLWREKRKTKPARAVADILRERNERRTSAVIACITEISGTGGPESVTHSLVAERVGLPLQWVEWQYPSRENLLAVGEVATAHHGCRSGPGRIRPTSIPTNELEVRG